MKKTLLKCALVIFTSLTIAGCKKDAKPNPTATNAPLAPGLFVLNAGPGGSSPYFNSASTLSFYNLKTKQVTVDQYGAANGKALGCSANDIEIYGSKMYIALTNSNVVSIVNVKTGRLITQDSLLNHTAIPLTYGYYKRPRDIAFYKGNAYISCYDGTIAVIDTTSLAVTTTITLKGYNTYQGFNTLEGLVVQNAKLYIAAAGGRFGINDTVSVVDLATNKEIKRIGVVPNPASMAADSYGNVYVLSGFTDDWQQYNVSTGGLTIIDSKTDTLKSPPVVGYYQSSGTIPITVNGDLVYYVTGAANKIAVYNAKTQTPVTDNFITDGTTIQLPFCVSANPVTGEVYIGDAKDSATNGLVDVFSAAGKLEYTFPVGAIPLKIKLVN